MKEIQWQVLYVAAFSLTMCSVGSWTVYLHCNREGDGLMPSQTLTATLLGFARDSQCTRTDDGWACEASASHLRPIWWRHLPKDENNRTGDQSSYRKAWPIATFVALWVPWPLEWITGLTLLALATHELGRRKPEG